MYLFWKDAAGEHTQPIPGYGLTVQADGQLDWENASGETSSAVRVFKGWRP